MISFITLILELSFLFDNSKACQTLSTNNVFKVDSILKNAVCIAGE